MARISWTEVECSMMVEHCHLLLKSGECLTRMGAFKRAQEYLPFDRRRNITSVKQIPWLDAELDNLAARLKDERSTTVETPVGDVEVDSLIEKLSSKLAPMIATLVSEVLSPVRVQEAMNQAVSKYIHSLDSKYPEVPPTVTKVVKPRVVLVNLLPTQFNDVKHEFHELFDLVHWIDGEDGYTKLRSHANTAHKIYGMTDFMKHSVDKFLSTNAKDRYVRFTGSVSTLKSLLEAEYCAL